MMQITEKEAYLFRSLINDYTVDRCQYKIDGIWLHEMRKKIDGYVTEQDIKRFEARFSFNLPERKD